MTSWYLKAPPGGILDASDFHADANDFIGIGIGDIHAEGALVFLFEFECGIKQTAVPGVATDQKLG